MPVLHITDDRASTLSTVEVEFVARTRRLDHHDAADYATLIADHSDEPTPALLIVTSHRDPTLLPRLDAILHLGQLLGVGALIHHQPATTTGTVAVEITVTPNTPSPTPRASILPPSSRLCILTAEDAASRNRTHQRLRSQTLDIPVAAPAMPSGDAPTNTTTAAYTSHRSHERE